MTNIISCFDAHFHIIDHKYPLVENNGYLPEDFIANDYNKKMKELNLNPVGGAIVSGSFQAFDQSYLIESLKQLGENYVGVTNLEYDAPDEKIIKLNANRIKAVRFNLYRGGSETTKHLKNLASRVHDLANWHIELYVDSKDLKDLSSLLLQCPKISIDHLGMSKEGFSDLLKLVEKGSHVKATGFMRINFDAIKAMRTIYSINPNALVFGTDLPGTRAPRCFNSDDIKLLQDNFSEQELQNIMLNNAKSLYDLF